VEKLSTLRTMKFCCSPILFAASILCPFANTLAGEALPFRNPIPESVVRGDLTLHLEEWLTFPATRDGKQKTRINAMKPSVDGSDRLWVNDLEGLLYFVKNEEIHSYLDVRDFLPEFQSSNGLGGGLNFFAFHPEFRTNGLFYTVHSELPGKKRPDFIGQEHVGRSPLDGILVEWKTQDPAAPSFSGKFRELLRVRFPMHIHTMQDIAFNPLAKPDDEDYGLLYIGIGEGGSMLLQQYGNIHRLDSLLGTVARIDPLGSNSANGQYGIPDSNPWAGDGDESTLGEIWAYGFRNPHRFSWDTGGSGKFLITEIGESSIEEVNLGEAGRNYGWPHREGTFEFQLDPNKFNLLTLPEGDEGFTYPVAQFDHSDGDAINGGYVYRGKKHPLLQGKYLFGDITRGTVFYCDEAELEIGSLAEIKKMQLKVNGKETTMIELVGSGRVDLRIGIDNAEELYLMEKFGGRVYKIVSVSKNKVPQ